MELFDSSYLWENSTKGGEIKFCNTLGTGKGEDSSLQYN